MSSAIAYSLQTAKKPWSETITDDSYRFEVRSGDTYAADPADKERSEIKIEGKTFEYSKIYNIEYQFQVEAGAPNTANWAILGQLHAREDAADASAGPILALQLEGEKLVVVARADTAAVGTGNPVGVELYTSDSNIVRDHWYSVKLQIVVDPFGAGVANVWIDGKQVASYSGELGYNDVSGPYFKVGIYRSAANETLAVDYKALTIQETDHLDGQVGRDFYTQMMGDHVTGTSGVDTLYMGGQTGVTVSLAVTGAQNTVGQGVLTIQGVENLVGTQKNDILEGNAGANTLIGNGGVDTVSYARADGAVTVNLGLTTAQDTKGAGLDTLSGFQNVNGSAFNDTLIGDAKNNVLFGGAGNDFMMGGAGNDTFNGGDGVDTVSFADANVGVTASLALAGGQGTGFGAKTFIGVENLMGSAYADILTGDSGANTINGGAGADTLDGREGVNSLYGEAGDDVFMVGGGGIDHLDGGAGSDTVSFAKMTTGVTINVSATGAQAIAGGSVTLVSVENVIGSAYNDVLSGSSDTTLNGAAGDDILIAGSGNQVLNGGADTDTVSFAQATKGISISLASADAQATGFGAKTLISIENLIGSEFGDTLSGNSGANMIKAGGGDDLVIVSTGSDVLDGGAGIDTVSFDRIQNGVSISLAVTDAQSTGFGTQTLANFENLTGSAFADHLSGNAGNNIINGGAGDDVLVGNGGVDRLNGGDGNDTVSFANAAAGVTLNLAVTDAQSTLPNGSVTLVSIENVIGSLYNDVLTGTTGDNVLSGLDGADTLIVSGGSDTFDGGGGSDTVSFVKATTGVSASLSISGLQSTGYGKATFISIENLTGSAYADVLTGDAGDNTLSGGAGDDLMRGGLGNDVFDGGDGVDTVSFSDAAVGVTASLGAAGMQVTEVGTKTFVRVENLVGSNFDDKLTGDAGDNVLSGGLGNDTLSGGLGGRDTFDGGDGNDTVTFAKAEKGVTVNLGLTGSQDTGAGADTFISIENVIGSNYADTLTLGKSGGGLNGGGGNDLLVAGSGTQLIDGGSGVDTISFTQATVGVTVSLNETGAQATGVGSVTLANIENLTGSAYDDVLSGNSATNYISGGAGNDTIIVGSGNDTLDGGAGSDTVSFAQVSKGVSIYLTITGAQSTGFGSMVLTSIENLVGSAYNDRLVGDAGDNKLWGGDGADILDGGAGNDVLTGGAGADVFRFVATAGQDVITDFSLSQGDRVQITKGMAYSMSYSGSDTTVTFANGDALKLLGVHLETTDSWFTY